MNTHLSQSASIAFSTYICINSRIRRTVRILTIRILDMINSFIIILFIEWISQDNHITYIELLEIVIYTDQVLYTKRLNLYMYVEVMPV